MSASDRDGLLAAIVADPHDDVPRLVLADYLDERGDPLGEFIRLQLALEPLRIPRADLAEELERNKRLAGIPPGGDQRDPTDEVTRLLDREAELLRLHRAEWLGEAAPLLEGKAHFNPEFRRGFVASARIGLTALSAHGERLRRACPTLRRLTVLGTLGRGKELGSCAALAGLPELNLAGWLYPQDAGDLLRSPHLNGLRSLAVWIGNPGEEESIPALAFLRGLRELTLVQLYGGLNTEGGYPEAFDDHADGLEEQVSRERLDCRVRVERPHARRFPLDGRHVGAGLDAGHLPGGHPVLICEARRPLLIYFDGGGRVQGEEPLELNGRLTAAPDRHPLGYDREELLSLLGREIGFVPGPIFVREFGPADLSLFSCNTRMEELAEPRTTDPEEGETIASELHWWFSTGQFELQRHNVYWLNSLGRIHSSF